MKFRKPRKPNKARNLPRPAPQRTGEDPAVLDVSYRLAGDKITAIKIAKYFLTLKTTRYPDITLPEAVVFMHLEAEQEEFAYQHEYNSGRLYRGGAVIDFWLPNKATVIRVQGDYFHTRPERVELDLIQRSELAFAMIDGKRVERVVDVWESRLLAANRKHVILAALNGEELGQA